MYLNWKQGLFASLSVVMSMSSARAQFAVIDVASINQLVIQARTLQQQLATVQAQLSQAEAEYESITGSRGMQTLLSSTVRNYLPTDWPSLQAVMQGSSSAYPALSANFQGIVNSNSVLTTTQLATLPPAAQQLLNANRQSTALLQVLTRTGLGNSSDRFAAIQQLIDAISTARDQKGILELQTRIGAEQNMLENEQSKLQLLDALAQSQLAAGRLQSRELTVVAHGNFQTRFQATLP